MKAHTIEPLEVEESRDVTCSVWGLNDCGQLLSSDEHSERTIRHPTTVTSPGGIFGFVSGDFHTLVISDALKLHSAGLNIYGQLGLPSAALKEPSTHVLKAITVLRFLECDLRYRP